MNRDTMHRATDITLSVLVILGLLWFIRGAFQ